MGLYSGGFISGRIFASKIWEFTFGRAHLFYFILFYFILFYLLIIIFLGGGGGGGGGACYRNFRVFHRLILKSYINHYSEVTGRHFI